MSEANTPLETSYADKAAKWFHSSLNQHLIAPLRAEFPDVPLPRVLREVVDGTETLVNMFEDWPDPQLVVESVIAKLESVDDRLLTLFREIILRYRRHRAAETERLTEKTFHLELAGTLEQERIALDAFSAHERFLRIPASRLPRLKDYLPVQSIDAAITDQLLPRQYDEKFHILQAPQLFFPDMAYLRRKCEDRDTPLALAFLDIDDFKKLNSKHTETKIDRNVLPRFMQTLEAHVFHHGFAYRQGGDEYLVLLPSLSRDLSIRFLDELRAKLAVLAYPDIEDRTTISIGLCVADPECPLTDRELLDRANRAKNHAKQNGKNRIATYRRKYFHDEELEVVASVSQ